MTDQPNDGFHSTYNHNEFENIDGELKSFIYSQADNNVLRGDQLLSSAKLSTLYKFNETQDENADRTKTSSIEDSLEYVEPSSSEDNLEESSMDILQDFVNEVTVAMTNSDSLDDFNMFLAQNDEDIEMDGSRQSVELNSTSAVVEITTETIPDRINLKSVDSSNQEQLISVIAQPTENPRRRYKSEKKRRIKRLRGGLIILDLSKLKNYSLNSKQVLWLRLNLTTYDDDPSQTVYIHADILKYLSRTVRKRKDGSICIRLTQADIDRGTIELRDLSIIKKKENTYDFKLIPYDTSKIDNKSESYTLDQTETTAGNAKIFREIYKLDASQIQCQLLIEENGSYIFTHITCATIVMNEQKYQRKTKKSNKRLVKKNQKSGRKRRN